jgi:DNA polymerase-1
MIDPLLASIEAEAAANPMGRGAVPLLQSRTLLADGDALAYAAAGNDDTTVGRALHNLKDKIAHAQAVSGAGRAKILTTAESSHKGFRFAVARVKPYQGHRQGARRPKNWSALRDALVNGVIPDVELTTTAEADDLFGKWVTILGAENSVIYTEDKDMRMLPGWHLDWRLHTMHYVPPGTFSLVYNDKVFGEKWFWLQMLMGDSADYIPGLPFHNGARMGPKTAERFLAAVTSGDEAWFQVREAYIGQYKADWKHQMLEQAVLLWMRRDPHSNPFDVTREGAPLGRADFTDAIAVLKERIKESL